MANEIAVLGQLGMADGKAPSEKPEPPQTTGNKPQYIVHQNVLPDTGVLPSTGELKQAGYVMLGLLCLICMLILMFKRGQKS
jgi:LPXTG-motif cell wall-anchored protein